MITMEKAVTKHEKRKNQKEETTYTSPVYPAVDTPVPDVDLNTLSGKNIPWYIRLLVYVIAKVLPGK
jgi:hypothetical protein